MAKRYTRKVSSTERVYLANSRICPPFANQLISEGEGFFDISLWKKAVETASEANPGSRLILRGVLNGSRWIDSGIAPRVREVDGSKWSGVDPENAPFLLEPLDPINGPTCEFLLVHGNPLRVICRTLHAVMDGVGSALWAIDVYQALRGQKCSGSSSSITEQQLAKSFQKQGRTPAPHKFIPPTGKPEKGVSGVYWHTYKARAKDKRLLPKTAILLAREAWRHSKGPVRIAVPVDLRWRQPGLQSTGNLTNFIYITVEPHTTTEDIARSMSKQLNERYDGMLYWGDEITRFMPTFLIEKAIKKESIQKQETGLYRNSAVISKMPSLPTELFNGGGFKTTNYYGVPPLMELIPFFIGIGTFGGDTVNFIAGGPKCLMSNGRLEATMERLIEGLNSFDN